MVVDTIKEKLCVNKVITNKKEMLMVEGDMIVPDSKPDVLSTICTSGVVCIYKKELLNDKIRIDGNIDTYIMYLADDEKDKVRGISTALNFSETINVPGCQEGMNERTEIKLKSIECKVINGRKIGIKATLEVIIEIYSNDEVEIINEIQNANEIQILKERLKIDSLVGRGESKIYAKETVKINDEDNLAEILKSNISIGNKDIKISYNKVLAKAEANVKLMYLTEDGRINNVSAQIPIVGFVDIPNVVEDNICDVDYEIKNLVIKLNSVEEHSLYIEMEIGVKVTVYEEKEVNLIQDLYSPCEKLEFNKKKISTIMNKRNIKETKQIRDKISVRDIGNKNIIDVDVFPVIENENRLNNRVVYEGNLELNMILNNQDMNIERKIEKIPFEYIIEDVDGVDGSNLRMTMEVANQDFIVQDGGIINANVDLMVNSEISQNSNLNIMDEIQTNGEREAEDYSIVMYIVKKGDTLWNIAKEFGSTVDGIVRVNGIENPNQIYPGDKLFIPRYTRIGVSSV